MSELSSKKELAYRIAFLCQQYYSMSPSKRYESLNSFLEHFDALIDES